MIAVLVSLPTLGEDQQKILVEVEKSDHQTIIFKQENIPRIPSLPANEEVAKTLDQLQPGDEVFIEGFVSHHATAGLEQGKVLPFFVVEKVYPISLKALSVTDYKAPELEFTPDSTADFSPARIPVTAEVASAMTMTTSLLLMHDLTMGSTEPEMKKQLQTALFLSAGTMATMLFVYEQLTGKTKP